MSTLEGSLYWHKKNWNKKNLEIYGCTNGKKYIICKSMVGFRENASHPVKLGL